MHACKQRAPLLDQRKLLLRNRGVDRKQMNINAVARFDQLYLDSLLWNLGDVDVTRR